MFRSVLPLSDLDREDRAGHRIELGRSQDSPALHPQMFTTLSTMGGNDEARLKLSRAADGTDHVDVIPRGSGSLVVSA
jgi:hypothetical protein